MRRAARRHRSLVLLYHDIVPNDGVGAGGVGAGGVGAGGGRVVGGVTPELFRRQLELLDQLGSVVPLSALLERVDAPERPRFAITFDDDSASYVEHALPVLTELGLPATFFLSGRALHGLRPNWWDILDWHVGHSGLERTAALLGAPVLSARRLAAWCERHPRMIERLYSAAPEDAAAERLLSRDGIGRLAAAGTEIGFHTLHHPVLPDLGDPDLVAAVREGRAELEAMIGRRIRYFSYPHGRTDERVARAVAEVGYRAAFGSRGKPIDPDSARMMLDRWEPGAMSVANLRGEIAWRLNRPAA